MPFIHVRANQTKISYVTADVHCWPCLMALMATPGQRDVGYGAFKRDGVGLRGVRGFRASRTGWADVDRGSADAGRVALGLSRAAG